MLGDVDRGTEGVDVALFDNTVEGASVFFEGVFSLGVPDKRSLTGGGDTEVWRRKSACSVSDSPAAVGGMLMGDETTVGFRPEGDTTLVRKDLEGGGRGRCGFCGRAGGGAASAVVRPLGIELKWEGSEL